MSQNTTGETRGGVAGAGLALGWALFVLVYYFWKIGLVWDFFPRAFRVDRFPPASASQFLAVTWESISILVVAALILTVTLAWGARLSRFLSVKATNAWLGCGINFGLGILFLDLLWLGTGLGRIWYPSLGTALAFLLMGVAARDTYRWWRGLSGVFKMDLPRDPAYWFILFCGLFYLLFSMASNLLPDAYYDSMVYHLAVPSYWLLNHGLRDFPSNFFSTYPYGGELFYLNGLVLQGTEAAKMLHSLSFGFCALVAGGWALEIGGARAGWLTFPLVLTLPLLSMNTWTTQVEGILALALILFLYFFHQWLSDPAGSNQKILMAGLLMGLALSMKYTAGVVIASALLSGIIIVPRIFLKISWRQAAVGLLPVLLLAAPWFMKNTVYTGNPFFPYLMSLFEGRHLPPESYQKLLTEQRGWLAGGWEWFYLPWKLIMKDPDGFNFSGPLALSLVPLLFLFRLRHPALRFLSLAALLFFTSGFCVTHILRFLGTGFVLVYILLGSVLGGADRTGWGRGLAWAGGLTAVFCFGYLSDISGHYASCAGVWSGRQTRAESFVSSGKTSPYYPMAQWISENTPKDARLLIAGDARGLYYDRSFLTNSVFDGQILALCAKEEKDAAGIRRRLRKMGADYLVVNGVEGIRISSDYHHYDLTPEEWKRLDDFIQRGTEVVYFQNLRCVYRLLPVLKETPAVETADLFLFFSQPAADYMKNLRAHLRKEAGENLDQIMKLVPFSKVWQKQKKEFDLGADLVSP